MRGRAERRSGDAGLSRGPVTGRYSGIVVSHFVRAMRLRCPHCGGGPIFTSWSRLLPACPVCGLGLERGEQGYWLGAYFFNLMAMETVFSVWVAGFLLATWPDPPWDLFQVSTVVLMVVFPFLFFPVLQDAVPRLRPADAPARTRRTSRRRTSSRPSSRRAPLIGLAVAAPPRRLSSSSAVNGFCRYGRSGLHQRPAAWPRRDAPT